MVHFATPYHFLWFNPHLICSNSMALAPFPLLYMVMFLHILNFMLLKLIFVANSAQSMKLRLYSFTNILLNVEVTFVVINFSINLFDCYSLLKLASFDDWTLSQDLHNSVLDISHFLREGNAYFFLKYWYFYKSQLGKSCF